MSDRSPQIVVVGAGLTGLACAHRLLSLGLEPLVLEAGERPGGKIATVTQDGYEFESGPNTLMPTGEGAHDLLTELELDDDIIEPAREAKKRYVLFHGMLRPVPASPFAALASPLLGPAGIMGVLGDLVRRRPPGTPDDETVAAFVRRRFGPRVLDNLVAPFLSGVYAGDPDRLEAASALRKLVEAELRSGSVIRGMIAARRAAPRPARPRARPRSITFRGGLQTLPARLAEHLGNRLRLSTAVESIELAGQGCEVRTADGDRVACEQVVLACEPPAAAPLVRSLPGGGPIATDLLAVEIAAVSVVGLAFARRDIRHPLDGFGYLAGPGSQGPVLGCLFRSSFFPHAAPAGQALLAVFVGGARHDLRSMPEQEIIALTVREVSARLGISGPPTRTFVRRWPAAIAQANRGHAERRRRIAEWSKSGPVSIISSAIFGVPLNDCIVTGRDEAERIGSVHCESRPTARTRQEVASCR